MDGCIFRQIMGLVMTGDEHDLFCKFIKIKQPIFPSTESKDAGDFIIDCHERLHKMGLVKSYVVELVTF